MKKYIITMLVFLSVVAFSCRNSSVNKQGSQQQPSPADGQAEIVFREYEHDFGKVTGGEKLAYLFSFSNKGPGSLVIKSATASCGCTVPKYETKPIPAGSDGTIEVVFDTSGRDGIQTKTVSVHSNANTPVVILKITAEIINSNNN